MKDNVISIASSTEGHAGRACVLAAIEHRGPFSRVEWDVVGTGERIEQALPSRGAAEARARAWAHDAGGDRSAE